MRVAEGEAVKQGGGDLQVEIGCGSPKGDGVNKCVPDVGSEFDAFAVQKQQARKMPLIRRTGPERLRISPIVLLSRETKGGGLKSFSDLWGREPPPPQQTQTRFGERICETMKTLGKGVFSSRLSLKLIDSDGALLKSSLADANGTDHQTCSAELMLTFRCKLCLISNLAWSD